MAGHKVQVLEVDIFLGSSVVEQTTVNRWVAGSNPARGAIICGVVAQLG